MLERNAAHLFMYILLAYLRYLSSIIVFYSLNLSALLLSCLPFAKHRLLTGYAELSKLKLGIILKSSPARLPVKSPPLPV